MLGIIACHFSVHGHFEFQTNLITLNRLWTQFILMGGSLGNSIFVLISGYFLINSSGISLRKLIKFWLKIFFYSVTIYALFIIFGNKDFEIKEAIKIILPVSSGQWWFASYWFVMYMAHPYLNILLRNLSKINYQKMLITFFILWSILPMIFFNKFQYQCNNLLWFMYLYGLAGYIRLHADNFGSWKYILYGLVGILINFSIVVMFDVIGLKFHIFAKHSTFIYGMRHFTILFITACLLIGFKNLRINSNFINLISSATFGVYLIHDNNFIRKFLWLELFKNASYSESPYLIIYSILVIILVFSVCTSVDLLVQKILRLAK